jgi:CheY-like chemotaxis protein
MATSTNRGLVGYNVQTAMDARHYLIVAHEVCQRWRQLIKMAKQTQAVMDIPELQVVADRDYFNGDEILACDEAGITAYVPKPMTSEARAQARFDKADFVYDPDTDTYRCPAGSQLIRRFARVEAGHLIHRYWSSDCPHCAIKDEAHAK